MEGLWLVSQGYSRSFKEDLRPTYAKVSSTHSVHFGGLLYTVEMQDYGSKRGIVWVRQCIDECVHRVSTHSVIINACSIDEFAVEVPRE